MYDFTVGLFMHRFISTPHLILIIIMMHIIAANARSTTDCYADRVAKVPL